MYKEAMGVTGLALAAWLAHRQGIGGAAHVLWVSLIVLSSLVIWRAGDFFAPASSFIQTRTTRPSTGVSPGAAPGGRASKLRIPEVMEKV